MIPIGGIIIGTITGIGTLVGDGILGMALIGVGDGTLGMVQIGAGDGIIGTALTGDGMVGMEILGTIIIMRTEEGTDCTEDIQMVAIITTLEEIETPIITLVTEIHIPTEVPTEALILTL
jgi:hypothetical protein